MPDKSFAKPNREVIEAGRKFAAIFRPTFESMGVSIAEFTRKLDLSTPEKVSHWLHGKIKLPHFKPPFKHNVQIMVELLPLRDKEEEFRKAANEWENAYLREYQPDKYELKHNKEIYDLCLDEDDNAKLAVASKIRSLIKNTLSRPITEESPGNLIGKCIGICGYTNSELSLLLGVTRHHIDNLVNNEVRLGLGKLNTRYGGGHKLTQYLRLESISPGLEQEFISALSNIYDFLDGKDLNNIYDNDISAMPYKPVKNIIMNLLKASNTGVKIEYKSLKGVNPNDLAICSYLKRLDGLSDNRKEGLRIRGFRERSGETPQEVINEVKKNPRKGLLQRLKEIYGYSYTYISSGIPINPNLFSEQHKISIRRELFIRFNSLDMVPTKEDMEVISSNIFCNEPPESQKRFSRILAMAYNAKDEEPDLDIRNNSLVKKRERCNLLERIKTERRLSTNRVYTTL